MISQRGEGLAERLAHAHLDAGGRSGTIQVGMDTPRLLVADYLDAGRLVECGNVVIGPARDGGWWLLGLPDPTAAQGLVGVVMSQEDTCAKTEEALGGDVVRLRTVLDMDTWDDALEIVRDIPISHLAQTMSQRPMSQRSGRSA
ncbi:DUF2064 domain-containing protein [Aeromicrobium sp. UC242_57]|uniref:DUF2064 domain-containing protein n=1 Tax=Aeromicrobium sp. UC242_57 TaxID=3374624 RepID=UPI003798F280